MTMIRSLVAAIALLALFAPGASAHDAEIFASNNTAVITDPADPRLDDPLVGFEREVSRIIEDGGGLARGSQLLDGVFFSAEQNTTTFERSRAFAVDSVEEDELHTIADAIRARFGQQSVLTFDRLAPADPRADAIRLDVPGVTAQDLRDGLLADAEARERLFGGSVTQADHLLLVADRADGEFALAFAQRIGGDVKRARSTYGEREFVEGPLPVRVEQRTLVVEGEGEMALAPRGGRLAVTVGGTEFSVARHRFDRIRVRGGAGIDTLALEGTPGNDRIDVMADRITGRDEIALSGIDIVRLSALAGSDRVTVGEQSEVFQVDADLGPGDDRATVLGSDEDDQISVGSFGVLGPTFVRFPNAELIDRLTVDGRGGDDIVSASVATMRLTLAGGDGDNVLLGGPGDDTLVGGDGFDDVRGGPGDDVALLGGDFDRFSWRPGDGNDRVDGGESRDSLSFSGSGDAETFDLSRDGRGLRLLRDVGAIDMDLDHLEEIDLLAGGGADTVDIGNLRRTSAQLVDVSLAPIPITAGGDGAADRVLVAGTEKADHMQLTGKVVVAGTATLTGLPATVNVSHAETADTLAIDSGPGKDTLDTTAFDPRTMLLDVS
jgi:hypothetical protein